MYSRSWSRFIGLAAALSLCACGEDLDNTYLFDFGYSSDTIRWAPDGNSFELAPNAFVSSDGIYFEVQSLTFRMADLRMDLPPQVRCADYEGTLSSEMSCEDSVGDQPGALRLPGPVEVGTAQRLTVGEKQVFIPRGPYSFIDTRWAPGTPERPSFQLRALFFYQGKNHTLEFAFQSDEPLRFESRGVPMGLPRELAKHPAAFGGRLRMDDWLKGLDVSGCLASGDLTLDGNVLRLETGRNACADAASNLRLTIQQSGDLFTGLRLE